jgi:hypothetical protein
MEKIIIFLAIMVIIAHIVISVDNLITAGTCNVLAVKIVVLVGPVNILMAIREDTVLVHVVMELVAVALIQMLSIVAHALLAEKVMDRTAVVILLVHVIVVLVIAAQIKMLHANILLVLMYLKHVGCMVIQQQLIFYASTPIKLMVKI